MDVVKRVLFPGAINLHVFTQTITAEIYKPNARD